MENTVVGLEKVRYNYLNDLQGNDMAICEDLETTTSSYCFSDIISEIADNWTEIYNSELFNIGFALYAGGYCDEAENELGSEGIISILQGAHYLYIQELLHDNISNIITNIAINYIDDNDLPIDGSDFENLESELESLNDCSYISDVEDTVNEFIKDKINTMFEEFNDDYFISSMCDGMTSKISECLETSFDIDALLDIEILQENGLDGQMIEEYDLLDEYAELCENIAIDLAEKFKELNSEYFVDRNDNTIIVRNSPKMLVDALSSMINNTMTVDEMNDTVEGEIVDEYEINEYYGGFRGGNDKEMIYENKSCSYQLGDEIWLNISWNIVEVNEEDCFKTVIKVTDVELI